MRTIVPVSGANPKTRLGHILAPDERLAFTEAMLADVTAAIEQTGRTPEVISTASVSCDVPVTIDTRGLDSLINGLLEEPLAVVMADLPLLRPAAIDRLFAPDTDVVLAPGLGGGTNAVVCRDPTFHVDYHDVSIQDHRAIVAQHNLTLTELDSRRFATDIDEPRDLAEVLLHSDGAAADWLRDAGFELEVSNGQLFAVR
jgi:2-phospho-L-lactate guanylyltransferase